MPTNVAASMPENVEMPIAFWEPAPAPVARTSGRTPHKDVTETCEYFARNHAKLVGDSVKAIKLAMAKHGEYRGVVAEA